MKRLALLAIPILLATGARAGPLDDLVAGRTAATPGIAGLAVVVADGKGIVRAEAFGHAVIEPPRALTVDTPMRVASISKAVVAIAVMRLVEAGKLDLDSDVSRWLGWRLRNPMFPDVPVTLRQLLSHTSGVEDGPGYALPLGVNVRDVMSDAAHWGRAPGGGFSYANLNYGLIGTVMEAATGERFDHLMTRLVLAPLSIDGGYNWSGASDAALARAAVLYRRGRDETAIDPAGPWVAQVDDLKGVRPACPVATKEDCDLAGYRPGTNGTMFSPQGGLRISALGLARIGRMLLGGGAVDGVRVLKRASVKALFTPVWRVGQGETGENYGENFGGTMLCYGPGLQCLSGEAGATDQPVAGARWWGHLGEAYGLLGGLWVDREHDRVMVYLITGTADDPGKAPHQSSFFGVEDAVLQELAATTARR